MLSAQTKEDIGKICIQVSPVSSEGVPAEAATIMKQRSRQLLNNSGIVDNGIDRRFEFSTDVLVLSKDILAGAPTRLSQRLEVVFSIRDVVDQITFASTSLNVVGVGLNETKSYISAFSSIKADNPKVQNMIASAKELIIAYYKSKAETTMQDARLLAEKGDYDAAIYSLSLIPKICGDSYYACQELLITIYQEKVNAEGNRLLSLAKAAWAESPDSNGASEAVALLKEIDICAECHENVDSLLAEITKKIEEQKQQEWEFMLKQYEDQRAQEQRDFEFAVRKYEEQLAKEAEMHKEAIEQEKRNHALALKRQDAESAYRLALLEASKDVAIAYLRK